MDMESQDRPDQKPGISFYQMHPRFPINFKTLSIFFGLLGATIFTTWTVGGPWYSFGLILILGAHEFGHYWTCRLNNVNASLPNFLPIPPIPYFLNIGTMGAFIAIKEPIPNRRALMEIGASGPIAGFIVAVPVLVAGLLNSQVTLGKTLIEEPNIFFGTSLILWGMTETVLGVDPTLENVTIALHPLAYAGWLGMFFTALNLMPMGQLDGGHVVYSLFSRKVALTTAWLSFFALLLMGFYWPGWWFWAGLVFIMGLRHPPVLDDQIPLEPKQRVMGYLSIAILILTFVPIPFGIGE